MDIVGEEEYQLPLYDSPLFQLTFSPAEDDDMMPEKDVELTTGTLQIKERVADSGRSDLSVTHHSDGDISGRYRFEILNRDTRICRYAGNEDAPWSVFCAVTNYGYSCQTAPKSGRKYAFDLLYAGGVELLQRVQKQEYEYSVGFGARVVYRLWHYLQLAAIEYQVGPDQMEDVISLLDERPGKTNLFEYDTLEFILGEFNVKDAFIPHSLRHPAIGRLNDNQREQDEVENKDSRDSEQPVWAIAKQRGRNEHKNEIYVSIIGSDAIDRFSFQITDNEGKKCVLQTNVVGDFPPYTVIESVREEFDITNIPDFAGGDEMGFSDLLVSVDDLVRRITSQIEPDSDVTEKILDEYISTLEVYLSVVAAYEIAPEEYNQGIERAFSKLGIELTSSVISRLNHSDLDQISTVAFQNIGDTGEVNQQARELLDATQLEKRRRVDIEKDPDVSLLARLHDKDY